MIKLNSLFNASLASLLLVAGTGTAAASTITFTETTTGSGSLGSTAFNDSLITITAVADTSTLTQPSSGQFFLSPATVTIDIAALNLTATLSAPGDVFSSQSVYTVGIDSSANGYDILDDQAVSLATYGLTTNLPPTNGSPIVNGATPFTTDDGDFILSSAGAVTLSAATDVSPEPSAIALSALGLTALLAFFLRRSSASR